MGTSLTQEQARLIKRYADTVLISYDGDGAGQKANMRGLEILKDEGLNVKVVPLPEGLDPDDVIKQRGPEGYRQCLDAAMPFIDYKLSVLEKGYDMSRTDEKRKFVTEAIKIVRTADSAAEQEELLKKLRDKTGITYESLSRDLHSAPVKETVALKSEEIRKDDSSVTVKASRFVIAAYLFGAKYAEEDISGIPFCNELHNIIANYIRSKKLLEERIQPAELFEFVDENTPEYEELCRILDFSDGNRLSGQVNEDYFFDCIKRLKIHELDIKIDALRTQAKGESDVATAREVLNKINGLIQQKEKLKSGDRK